MRRAVAVIVVMAGATVVVIQGQGAAGVVLWEILVLAALVVVSWRRWPRRPRRATPLFGGDIEFRPRPPGTLGSLELEVAGATDQRLGGDLRFRRRLISLAEHRAGLAAGSLSRRSGSEILGGPVWETLVERKDVLTPAEVEMMVSRIEAL